MFSFIKNRKEHQRAEKELRLIQAYKTVFNSDDGKLVLDDILEVCGLTFCSIDENPYVTYANDGKRFVGMHVLSNLEATEEKMRELFRRKYSTIEDMEESYNE
jgi:hypothetical protein